ncbi:hypothetical protein EDB92DRAFT_1949591 [Lactarius akahatsu]|uniref:Uncharacterized protein n=1 Tax=Lactarius akahatsu TaxID=416441 RepID=A0AAD4LFZ0_9AGAM|nr:hypothetical protein EDB92DRAFT_1949591 [Lactarius akahatsu]
MASGAPQNTVDFVMGCHQQLSDLLTSLAEESQSSKQPGSPYPDANAPIGSPPFSEGGMVNDDAMNVDDDYTPQEGGPMGTESDNSSDHDVNSSVIFKIPEETLNATPDPGSESGSGSSQLGDNDGFLASDEDFPPYGGGDLPEIITQLQKQLAETLSLQHYLAWIGSNGTVKAYNAHAQGQKAS